MTEIEVEFFFLSRKIPQKVDMTLVHQSLMMMMMMMMMIIIIINEMLFFL